MTVAETLQARGDRYGGFANLAAFSQHLKRELAKAAGYSALSDCQKESIEMIALKLARILNGNPDHIDNWHDIAGYAQLVEAELNK